VCVSKRVVSAAITCNNDPLAVAVCQQTVMSAAAPPACTEDLSVENNNALLSRVSLNNLHTDNAPCRWSCQQPACTLCVVGCQSWCRELSATDHTLHASRLLTDAARMRTLNSRMNEFLTGRLQMATGSRCPDASKLKQLVRHIQCPAHKPLMLLCRLHTNHATARSAALSCTAIA
jgi:hypothetical protein